MAAILALSAGPALAQAVTQSTRLQPDMAGFNGAPDSLTTMIGKIESGTGGRVIEIRFTNADGMPGYRAVVDHGAQLEFKRIAATNGDAVEISSSNVPPWMLHWRQRKAAEIARDAKVPLSEAIRTAEKEQDGSPALAAGVATSATNPSTDVKAYNVLVYHEGDVVRVAVDGDTDKVIANPQALASWP
jgi:uncharacterized membrane protein YkoI